MKRNVQQALETYHRLVREYRYPPSSAFTAAMTVTPMGPSSQDLRAAIAAQEATSR
jgi:hypothetical protein